MTHSSHGSLGLADFHRGPGASDLPEAATRDVSAALALLLADVFAVYLKTKNFHWHMAGPNFVEYHELLDAEADALLAMTDPLAERARKLGGPTLKSIGQIARLQRIADNDAEYVDTMDMLSELREDNLKLLSEMRQVHATASGHNDVGTTSLLETYIDETEKRVWFLREITHRTSRANR